MYIIGPAGDGGNALGAALFAYYHILAHKKMPQRIENLYLGTSYSNSEIEHILAESNLSYTLYKN